MRGDRNVRSSDLDRARALSRQLRGKRTTVSDSPHSTAAHAPPSEQAAFSGYLSDDGVPVTEASVREDSNPAANFSTDTLGSRLWNDILGECIELAGDAGAVAAFAVDMQGLAIAQVGEVAAGEIEATGSRLVIAIEQAARMESFAQQRPQSIQIDFGASWLTGIPVAGTNDMEIIVGIVSRDTTSGRARALISNLVGEVLTR